MMLMMPVHGNWLGFVLAHVNFPRVWIGKSISNSWNAGCHVSSDRNSRFCLMTVDWDGKVRAPPESWTCFKIWIEFGKELGKKVDQLLGYNHGFIRLPLSGNGQDTRLEQIISISVLAPCPSTNLGTEPSTACSGHVNPSVRFKD